MKLAPGWSEDLDAAGVGGSVLLACTYAEHPTSWIRGEAVREWETKVWHWVDGRQCEPSHVPRAWMPIPFVLADD